MGLKGYGIWVNLIQRAEPQRGLYWPPSFEPCFDDCLQQKNASSNPPLLAGRSREKVYDFVRIPELYYAGSHGGALHVESS
jgi:hypothetical protein